MTTMHDDDGNEYDDDDNDGDNDDHDVYGHDELIMNIADSRVVLGTHIRLRLLLLGASFWSPDGI